MSGVGVRSRWLNMTRPSRHWRRADIHRTFPSPGVHMNAMSGALLPASSPRRVEALAIIVERLRRGSSPSYAEIGRAMNPAVGAGRARHLVDQLVRIGVIDRDVGSHRGIVIRDFAACRALFDTALGETGWWHAAPLAPMAPPDQCSFLHLPLLPLIELPPDA